MRILIFRGFLKGRTNPMPYPLPSGSHTGLGKRNYLLPILAKNNLGLPSSIQSRRSRIKINTPAHMHGVRLLLQKPAAMALALFLRP
jgi:hypothetical protein